MERKRREIGSGGEVDELEGGQGERRGEREKEREGRE